MKQTIITTSEQTKDMIDSFSALKRYKVI